jgi:GH3 auxin-responsive promoter
MLIDNGLFYEFVPVEDLERPEPVRHWIGTAGAGREYALVLSSNAGLWCYLLGDTVRLVDLDPPRLLVTGRTSYFLFGFRRTPDRRGNRDGGGRRRRGGRARGERVLRRAALPRRR